MTMLRALPWCAKSIAARQAPIAQHSTADAGSPNWVTV